MPGTKSGRNLATFIITLYPSLHDVCMLTLRNGTIMRRGPASCQHCPPTPRRRFKQKNGLARHETFIPSKWMMTVEVRGGWLAPVPPLLLLPPLKRCYLTRGGRMTLGPTGNSHSLPSPPVRREREWERTEGGGFCTNTYVPPVCELRGLSPPFLDRRNGVLESSNRYEKTRFKRIVFPFFVPESEIRTRMEVESDFLFLFLPREFFVDTWVFCWSFFY